MRTIRFLVGLVAAGTLAAACAGYTFPGGSSTGTGTITGQVLAVPCAPVEKVGSPCQGRPVSNSDVVFTSEASHDVVTTRTDSSGHYSVELAAGTWGVAFKGIMRIISGPKSVTIEPGETVVANYLVDSGIRVPAAAAPSS